MCMLHFLLLCMCCIFYMPGFGGSPAGEADKIGKIFFKKILCSLVMFISPMYIIYVSRLAEEHKFEYISRLAEERKFVYVRQFWTEKHKVGYVPRFWTEERKIGYVP
jgi:hypothetical protein